MGTVRVLGMAVVLVLAAVACGDDGGESGSTTTTMGGVEDPVEAYFEALASSDPAEMDRAAEQYAVPGSHAETYALMMAAMHRGGGIEGFTPETYVSVTDGAVEECLAEVASGFTATTTTVPPDLELCREISDVAVDDDGLLTGFSVHGNDLSERLALGGPTSESEGVKFVLVGGYQPFYDTFHVVVEVFNSTSAEFDVGGRGSHGGPPDNAVYTTPDGDQVEAIGFEGVGLIRPGRGGPATEVFPDTAFGGTFTYGGTLDDGNDTEVTVDIPITLAAD